MGLDDQECLDVLLVQAVIRGELSDVKKALSSGAAVDTRADIVLNMGEKDTTRGRGRTPLMRACALAFEDIILHLLDAKANLSRCDSRRWTPLCHALGAGEVDLCERLLR